MAKKPKASINIKIDDVSRLCRDKIKCRTNGSCGGFAYFLGFIGAAVYYISTTTGFWNGVLGVLKAIVWPAFLIFHLMKFLGM